MLTIPVHGTLADLRAPTARRMDRGMGLVLDGDRLVGVVTAADVARAMELATLGRADRWPDRRPGRDAEPPLTLAVTTSRPAADGSLGACAAAMASRPPAPGRP